MIYQRGLWGWMPHGAFVIVSILLFSHKAPGFNNLLVFDGIRFSPDAVPFIMYLNIDLLWVLFFCFSWEKGGDIVQAPHYKS